MRHPVRTAAACLVVLSLLAGAWTWMLLHPSQDDPTPTDVSLYLASEGGWAAWDAGLAAGPVVLSRPEQYQDLPRYRVCGTDAVECFTPVPATTQGEAEAFAKLANRRQWQSVTIYTQTTHVLRTRLRFARCFGGRIHVVPVDVHPTTPALWGEVVHETGGWVKALLAPGCSDRLLWLEDDPG